MKRRRGRPALPSGEKLVPLQTSVPPNIRELVEARALLRKQTTSEVGRELMLGGGLQNDPFTDEETAQAKSIAKARAKVAGRVGGTAAVATSEVRGSSEELRELRRKVTELEKWRRGRDSPNALTAA